MSTISPPESPWGLVENPVTSPSITENIKLFTTVFVVPTDTIDLPITLSTLAEIVGSLKLILSLTLYEFPELFTVTFVIFDASVPSTSISAFESRESCKIGYLLCLSFNPKSVTFLLYFPLFKIVSFCFSSPIW